MSIKLTALASAFVWSFRMRFALLSCSKLILFQIMKDVNGTSAEGGLKSAEEKSRITQTFVCLSKYLLVPRTWA
jgi:hypothetical protein